MPRAKSKWKEQQDSLIYFLRLKMLEKKWEISDLSTKSAIPESTLYRKFKMPGTITFEDLHQIFRALGTNYSEFAECLERLRK